MSRLTHRNENGEARVWLYSDPKNMARVLDEQSRKEVEVLEKLAHYEDLEEAGRLITLPCKVGDTVWCVTDKHIFVAWVDSFYLTEEDGVLSIEVNLTDVVENDIEIKASSFGRKVFLTKAEAEQKLAELKGE